MLKRAGRRVVLVRAGRSSWREVSDRSARSIVRPVPLRGGEAAEAALEEQEGASAAIGVAGADLGGELAQDSHLATQLRHAAEAIGRMFR